MFEDGQQDLVDPLGEVVEPADPADQVLDQRLGHPGVDVVVRHLVAHPVGAPAQRQLRQVAGAQHDAVVVVGQPEQVVGAEPRLHVLEGDVVDLLAATEWMVQGRASICRAAGRMSSSAAVTSSARISAQALGLGELAGGETGHGEA